MQKKLESDTDQNTGVLRASFQCQWISSSIAAAAAVAAAAARGGAGVDCGVSSSP